MTSDNVHMETNETNNGNDQVHPPCKLSSFEAVFSNTLR